ncbi:MAG TPA: helix-turn-helix transcriptional regulator [Symbiobacteriaceae bacterium]|jgi:transcriptional regulator with XRE-family HTH domain
MTNEGLEAELLPFLPRRLKELRLEMGWSLEDVAKRTGVTQRGVASNWEATNQRRRTPPLTTLIVLQRWYGVSLDYLVGHPNAERESPAVKAAKRALRERLQAAANVVNAPPAERARLALSLAMETAPEAFFRERAEAFLLVGTDQLESMLYRDGVWPDPMLERLAEFLGIKSEWFYSREPAKVLEGA